MSVVRRLIGGSAANAASIAFGAAIQLASVPVLISAWGASTFGVWLMLTTIPTYFALTDLGFIQAATADMTMHHARGDRVAVLRTFQSTAILLSFLLPVALLGAGTLIIANSIELAMPAWMADNAAVLALLLIYSALTLISRVFLAGFRSTGHYAQGTVAYDAASMLESIAVLSTAIAGGGFVTCVIVQLALRLTSMVALHIVLRRTEPWLQLGGEHASRQEVKRLLGPALSAMAIPTSLALSLQGFVLVVGAMLSPVAAATFVAVRTVSRLFVQAVGIFNRASMPEIATAYAIGNRVLLGRLARANAALSAAILVPGGLTLVFAGPWLITFWTGGQLSAERSFFALMALGMILHGSWFFALSFLLSLNQHGRLGAPLLITAILSVVVAIPAGRASGINGIGATIAAADFICLVFVTLSIRRKLIKSSARQE